MAISDRMKKKTKESVTVSDFGAAGAPIDRRHPFYFGFVATIGALTAFVLMRALASASQVFVLILVALFLATGLNPAVEAIRRRGLSRTGAVTIIFSSVLLMVIIFAALVVPPLVSQGTDLIESAPALLDNLKNNATIASINDQYGIIDTLQKKLDSVTSDGTLLITAFGGVIGVGKSVLSGTFTALTILVLTLYFITSLPQATALGLKLVPASRRPTTSCLVNRCHHRPRWRIRW
jgi:predicted PurR-regulated permease PerM